MSGDINDFKQEKFDLQTNCPIYLFRAFAQINLRKIITIIWEIVNLSLFWFFNLYTFYLSN